MSSSNYNIIRYGFAGFSKINVNVGNYCLLSQVFYCTTLALDKSIPALGDDSWSASLKTKYLLATCAHLHRFFSYFFSPLDIKGYQHSYFQVS